MMNLKLQISSIIISFIFGICFFFGIHLISRLLMHKKNVLNFIIYFLVIIFSSIIYFFILKKINYGVVHVYFFLSVFTGYILSYFLNCKFIVKLKKR